MNALQFISKLVEDKMIESYQAGDAYDMFISNGGEGSYPYFRTQFNNTKKSLGLNNKTNLSVTYNPKAEVLEEKVEPLPVRIVKKYNSGETLPEVPDLIPTGTLFDEVICDRVTTEVHRKAYFEKMGEEMPDNMIEVGGFTRKCVDIVAGDPGAGKTYSRCVLAAMAKLFAKKEFNKDITVHFISGEMRETEWAKELKDNPFLRELQVTYMLDYVGYPNYEDIFWEAFADGDIIICDSLPAIISHFKMSWDITKGKMPTENNMIFGFIRKALKSVEENNNNVQLINQANKDGSYKGGTELPHMMSSMSFVKMDGTNRYMIFSKNRNNGKVKRKIFFNKGEHGEIIFNVEAYKATYEKVNDKKQDIDQFINSLHNSQSNELDEIGEGSETEMTAYEMGTGGATAEELAELDSIPAHLRAEEGEDNFVPEKTDTDGQINLEDQIKFEEDQKKLREIEATKGSGMKNEAHYMVPGAFENDRDNRLRAEEAMPRLDLNDDIIVPDFLPDNTQEEE